MGDCVSSGCRPPEAQTPGCVGRGEHLRRSSLALGLPLRWHSANGLTLRFWRRRSSRGRTSWLYDRSTNSRQAVDAIHFSAHNGRIFKADRLSVNRASIVWLAARRQGIARKLRSTLTVLARRGEVAMDSRKKIIPSLNEKAVPIWIARAITMMQADARCARSLLLAPRLDSDPMARESP